MSENVEIVRRHYEDFNRGDLDRARDTGQAMSETGLPPTTPSAYEANWTR